MTTDAVERTQQILNSGDRAAWLSAALAVALDTSSPNAIRGQPHSRSCIRVGSTSTRAPFSVIVARSPHRPRPRCCRAPRCCAETPGSGPTSPIRHFWRRAARVLKEPRLFARSGYP